MNSENVTFSEVIEKYKRFFQSIISLPKNQKFLAMVSKLPFFILLLAMFYYVCSFSWISILFQNKFGTSAYDVGLYDQGIWLMSRFMAPFTTIKGVYLFGDHTSFYSALLAPFFWIWPSINVLYIAQSAFLSLAVLPVFLYARKRLANSFLAMAVGLSFLLYPALQNMNLENFHPEVMVVFFLCWALYFMLTGNFRLFYPFIILSVLGKEDVGISVFFIGLYLLFLRKQVRHGLITLSIGLGWYLFCSRVIMPSFNGIDIFSSQPVFYSYWFQGVKQNMFNLSFLVERIFSPEAIVYYKGLLRPVLYIPLLSPFTLFMMIPALAMNVLSGSDYLRSIYYHYNYISVCIVYFSLIEGLFFISRLKLKIDYLDFKKGVLLFAGFMLIGYGYLQNIDLSHFPLNRHYQIIKANNKAVRAKKVRVMEEAVNLVPPGASVSASHAFVPHLTHRKEIFMFPNPYRGTLWNMWFREGQDLPAIGRDLGYVVLDLDVHSGEDRLIIDYLRRAPQYKEVFNERQIVVLKNANCEVSPQQGANYILYKLDDRISLTDDFSSRLEVAGEGKFTMLYFPGSAYYFRNLLGEEIALKNGFGLVIYGYLFVPENGQYKFDLKSNAECFMEIDGKNAKNALNLSSGFHKYSIKYLNKGQKYDLSLVVKPPQGKNYIIPDQHLMRKYDGVRFKKVLWEHQERQLRIEDFVRTQPNLVKNGGFETAYGYDPSDWKLEYWEEEGSGCSYVLTSKTKRKGKYSAKLENNGLADSRWTQLVEVHPDTYYKLSGWIKTVGIPKKAAGAHLVAENTEMKTEVLYGTDDWRYVEAKGKTGQDEEQLKILCRLGNYGSPNMGTAYFDQIELKEILSIDDY